MLEFVGYHALSPVITYAPAHLGEHERLAALDAVRSSFRLIASNAAPLSH
jgi:NAD(P)H dehydrogenase (quinone)